MIRLQLLGGATVEDRDGLLDGRLRRRHPIALLAVLAAEPARAVGRSRVVGLLWPDSPEDRARSRLNSCLYRVRRALDANAVRSVGDDLQLDRDLVSSDVTLFRAALDEGDPERAVEVYRGPFLEGFRLPRSAAFERWSDGVRERLRRRYLDALQALAEAAEAADRPAEAIRRWQQRVTEDPYDSRTAARLVRLLASAGNPAEALRVAESHVRRIEEDLGISASDDVRALVESLRAASAPLPGEAEAASGSPWTAPEAGGSGARPNPSVAVLPLEVLGEPTGGLLGEGIHSGILTRLSRVSGLDVIARTSVRRYRASEKPVPEIARELGVAWIVEGEVQEGARQYRVNIRLVEAASRRQVWAESYAGVLSEEEVFPMQAEIAKRIVRSLELELTPEERKRVERHPTESFEAYRLYTRGRSLLDRRTEEAMRRALEVFERVVELDDGYALARVGVADALGLLHAYGYADAEEVLPRAERALRRALELDPESAEAHAALGRLHGQRNEALAADREMKTALALKPSYADAHSWLTVGNQVLGRPEAALDCARRAVALNPLSPEAVCNLAMAWLIHGEHELALAEARHATELVPAYATGEFFEGLALYEMGRFDEAASTLEDLMVPWAPSAARAALALARIGRGDPAGVRTLLEEIRSAGHLFDAGLVHAALGEVDHAFDAIEEADFRSLDHGLSYWPTLAVRYLFGEVWSEVQDDPRHGALIRRVDEAWGLTPTGA